MAYRYLLACRVKVGGGIRKKYKFLVQTNAQRPLRTYNPVKCIPGIKKVSMHDVQCAAGSSVARHAKQCSSFSCGREIGPSGQEGKLGETDSSHTGQATQKRQTREKMEQDAMRVGAATGGLKWPNRQNKFCRLLLQAFTVYLGLCGEKLHFFKQSF